MPYLGYSSYGILYSFMLIMPEVMNRNERNTS